MIAFSIKNLFNVCNCNSSYITFVLKFAPNYCISNENRPLSDSYFSLHVIFAIYSIFRQLSKNLLQNYVYLSISLCFQLIQRILKLPNNIEYLLEIWLTCCWIWYKITGVSFLVMRIPIWAPFGPKFLGVCLHFVALLLNICSILEHLLIIDKYPIPGLESL